MKAIFRFSRDGVWVKTITVIVDHRGIPNAFKDARDRYIRYFGEAVPITDCSQELVGLEDE